MEDEGPVTKEIEVIEYFAGVGRIAQLARYAGYESIAFDMAYGAKQSKKKGKRNSLDLNSNAGLVLAIKLVLRSRMDMLVAIFAVCCSSFVPVNRGTGSRSILVPEGDENVVSVRKSNKLLSRKLGLELKHNFILK